MTDASGGAIRWVINVEDGGANAKLTKFSKSVSDTGKEIQGTESRISSSFSNFASNASSSFGSIADGLGSILKGVVAVGVGGSVGLGAMTKAAFDQVRQVENATFALRAYETDVGKVNQTLSELISFARSDLGVLFQREELFKAASNLRGFGEETAKITDRVKILARGVSLGMTTFDELSQIVGRATQAGKLSAEGFDQLAFRGIILNSSFRGASVSADQLYGELQRVLPASLLEDRANTIDGAFIRLQSAFRDLGSSILGVDKNTSKFIKGGLGDRFIGILRTLRDTLASPELKSALGQLGQSIAGFAEKAVPALVNGFTFIVENGSTTGSVLAALAAGFVVAKTAAIGFAIAANFNPIVAATVALVSALTFLQVKFDIFPRAAELIVKTYETARDSIGQALSSISKAFDNTRFAIGDAIEGVIRFIQSIPGAVGAARDTVQARLNDIGNFFKNVFGGINSALNPWREDFLGTLGNTLKDASDALIKYDTETLKQWGDTLSNVVKVVGKWGNQLGSSVGKAVEEAVQSAGKFFGDLSRQVEAALNGALRATAEWGVNLFNAIYTSLTGVLTSIDSFVRDFPQRFSDGFGAVIATVVRFGQDLFTNTANALMGLFNSVVGFFAGLPQMLSATLSNTGKQVADNTVNGVVDWFKAKETITKIGDAIVLGLLLVIASIAIFAVDLGFRIVGFMLQGIGRAVVSMQRAGMDILLAIGKGITDFIGFMVQKGREIAQAIVNGAVSFFSGLVDAGKNLVNGLVKGIGDGKDAVVNKVKDICKGALDAVKSFFGIKSPSKVMAQMGGFLMQGFTNGVERAGSGTISAVRNVSSTISDQFAEGTFDGRLMANVTSDTNPTAGSTSNGAVINQTNNIYNQVDMDAGWRDLSWRLAN